MSEARPVRAVAVVVPARDEEDTVEACLSSVRAALERLPAGMATTVTMVLDRCVDRTPDRVAPMLADWPGAAAVRVAEVRGTAAHTVGTGVGALRHLGVRDALARLHPLRPEQVWLLHTDADSRVPVDWALRHVAWAGTGAHAVAGMVDLDTPGPLSAAAVGRYDELVRARVDGRSHDHVHGANLGVRADAYLAVGGFPPDGAGEDRALCTALRRGGHRVVAPLRPRVRTSARTTGRAGGGLADLLRALHEDVRPPAAG